MRHSFHLWLQVLANGMPHFPSPDTSRARQRVGTAATRLFSDSAGSVPERFSQWASGAYAYVVRLLPRLAVAFVVAAVVLSLTVWIRTLVRRRASTAEGTTEGIAEGTAAQKAGALGILAAALLAAWIVGATVVAAALLTFAIFYAAAAALTVAGARARHHAKAPEAVDLGLTVARYALLILGIVEALDTLGLNLGGVIAGLGILGLAVGFAAQDVFANIISGFMILWDRSLRVGDWVRVKESEGRVRRITLRTTRIATRDEGILVIPNKEITGTTLYNFSLRPLTRVRVPVGVSYGVDIDAARASLLALVANDSDIIAEPTPTVAVTALGDSTVTLELIFFIADPRERAALRWRIFERILRDFRQKGIAIPYPQLDVHVLASGPIV
ncbi:MAG: mechanosensitive ion channel family protein [Gemmatimonadaceae bacterium]